MSIRFSQRKGPKSILERCENFRVRGCVCVLWWADTNTFLRQESCQGTLSTKRWVKICFSSFAPNLKIARREHSHGHSGSSSGICVFPDLCPTLSTCLVCVCVVPTVSAQPQLQGGHLESVSSAHEGGSGIISHHPQYF